MILNLLVFTSACQKNDERFSTPKKTYEFWMKTSGTGDIGGGMECLTKASQRFMDLQTKNRDIFIKRLADYSIVFSQYQVVEEKIKKDKAYVVLSEPKSGNTMAVPLLFEDGGWKVDLISMFGNPSAER